MNNKICFECNEHQNPYNEELNFIKIYWMQGNDGSNIPKFKEDDFSDAHDECWYLANK
jgi:hypothetical protein